MTDHIKIKHKLKEIASIVDFDTLLDQSTLSDTDKRILRLHYLEEKDFRYIGDTLGFSEYTIKQRHRKALKKIDKMF